MNETLSQLVREAAELAQQSMSGTGDTAVLQKTAQTLEAQLAELHPLDNPTLQLRWAEARRYLDVAQIALQPHQETMPEQAYRLSQAAFKLAQQVAAGKTNPGFQKEAQKIDQQLDGLSKKMDTLSPEDFISVEKAITDAQLDIRYILADGKAPTSIRLFYFTQDQTHG